MQTQSDLKAPRLLLQAGGRGEWTSASEINLFGTPTEGGPDPDPPGSSPDDPPEDGEPDEPTPPGEGAKPLFAVRTLSAALFAGVAVA